MSFADLNNEIKTKTGAWVNLKDKGDKIAGKLVAEPEVRDQKYNGAIVPVTNEKSPNFGKPRKEWVFTLETSDGRTVKVGVKESGQSAIIGALNGRNMELGGHLQLEIVDKQSGKQPEFKAIYTSPTKDFPTDNTPDIDEPPF